MLHSFSVVADDSSQSALFVSGSILITTLIALNFFFPLRVGRPRQRHHHPQRTDLTERTSHRTRYTWCFPTLQILALLSKADLQSVYMLLLIFSFLIPDWLSAWRVCSMIWWRHVLRSFCNFHGVIGNVALFFAFVVHFLRFNGPS